VPQQDESTGQLKHRQEVFSNVFPAGNEPPRIVKPGKESLNLPPATVATQGATILGGRIHAPHVVGSDCFGGVVAQELLIQFLAVVGAITDHSLRRFRDEALIQVKTLHRVDGFAASL
jgi:hypothetical protein